MPSFPSRLIAAATLCGAALACHAQSEPIQQKCGGIGSDESTRFRAEMKDHPLSLLFARPDGDYVADVQVNLMDASGKTLLDWKAGGPVCLVDLPAGQYKVTARSGGDMREHQVTVGKTPVRLDFRF